MSLGVIWSTLARFTDYSFSELEAYLDTVQRALNREKQHLGSWLDKELAGLDEDAADERAELYAEDFEQLTTTFPEIARRSAFLMIYSTFEHALQVFCWRIQKIKNQDFGPEDLRGEFCGTDAYLQRLAGIKLSGLREWQKIDVLRRIRNMLVHQGGNVRKNDVKFRALIKATPGTSLDNHQMIILADTFCLDALNTIRAYVKELASELRKVFHD
jgi:hypothetical protein